MRAMRDVEGEKGEGLREFAELAREICCEDRAGVQKAEAG